MNTTFVAVTETPTPTVTLAVQTIKQLAIAYAQFQQAAISNNRAAASRWAHYLLELQDLTGVVLYARDGVINDYL